MAKTKRTVTVRRTETFYLIIDVEAETVEGAEKIAEAQLDDDKEWEGVKAADVEIEAIDVQ